MSVHGCKRLRRKMWINVSAYISGSNTCPSAAGCERYEEAAMKRRVKQAITFISTIAIAGATLAVTAPSGSASPAAADGHDLPAGTRFYVQPPAQGSTAQILKLLASGQLKNAGLIAAMEAVPSAVLLTGETSAQAAEPGNLGEEQANLDVARQVRTTVLAADIQGAVPIFVAYNIPGRDCSQYSAGGAPSDAAYDSWIDSVRGALGSTQAGVVLEPAALANPPGSCGSAYSAANPDVTDTTRINDVAYGVSTLEQDPNISLYIDGGHSAWQAVGNIAEVLVAADVQQAQGFFLNVSNYQYATNNVYYGTWVSSC